MMNVKLKICGMRHSANIVDVAELRPAYMGFIFFDKSPRYVGEDFELPTLDSLIKKVGVFVNEKTERILEKVLRYELDLVQLHGNESSGECQKLKDKGLKIIKAFSVDRHFDFNSIKDYSGCVDYFLFDTKGKLFGGNATTFDWKLLKQYDQQIPFFLSGGISPENVSALKDLYNLNIYAVDVNSGVEVSPGIKDSNRIKELKRVIDSL